MFSDDTGRKLCSHFVFNAIFLNILFYLQLLKITIITITSRLVQQMFHVDLIRWIFSRPNPYFLLLQVPQDNFFSINFDLGTNGSTTVPESTRDDYQEN